MSIAVPAPASGGANRKASLYTLGAVIGTTLLQSDLKSLKAMGYAIEFLLLLRFVGSFAISAVAVVWKHKEDADENKLGIIARFKPVDWFGAVIGGFLMLGTTFGVFFGTLYLVVGQFSILGLACMSPLAILLGLFFFGERIPRPGLVVVSQLLSFAGLFVMLKAVGVHDLDRFINGALWVLEASVCTVLNQFRNRRANERGENKWVSMFWQSVPGFILVLALLKWGFLGLHKVEFDAGMVEASHVPYLVACFILGFLPQLFYLLAGKAPVTRTVPIQAIQPWVAAVTDRVRGDGWPDPLELGGMVLLLGGVFVLWPVLFAKAKQVKPGNDGNAQPKKE